MFVAVKRATLLYITGNVTSTTKHLYVLLTDPFGPAQQVALACVCSAKPNCDRTCILNVGDHPFIQHESYVAYNLCRLERADAVVRNINRGIFFDKGLLDEPVFNRILAGVNTSKAIKPFVIEFLAECNK